MIKRKLIWQTGPFEITVYGATDEECWAHLGRLLKGDCLSWCAEFRYEDYTEPPKSLDERVVKRG